MTVWLEKVRTHRALGLGQFPADARSWHDGALGELLVGQELSFLPPEWHVLHAVPAGSAGADIDHLVIGPPGIFVLNTKRHPNAMVKVGTHVVWINGYQQNHYQSTIRSRCEHVHRQLFSATNELSPVHPVLVFAQAQRLQHQGPQVVMSAMSQDLTRFLVSLPAQLTTHQVRNLAEAAAKPRTWGASDRVLSEPDPTFEFLALSSEATTRPARPARRSIPFQAVRAPSRPRVGPVLRPPVARPVPRARRRSTSSRFVELIASLIGLAIGLPIAIAVLTAVLHAWTQALMSR